MGNNTHSSPYRVTHFPADAYTFQEDLGHCNLVRNMQNDHVLEEYDMIPRGNLSIDEELQFYEYRRTQNKHLVKV